MPHGVACNCFNLVLTERRATLSTIAAPAISTGPWRCAWPIGRQVQQPTRSPSPSHRRRGNRRCAGGVSARRGRIETPLVVRRRVRWRPPAIEPEVQQPPLGFWLSSGANFHFSGGGVAIRAKYPLGPEFRGFSPTTSLSYRRHANRDLDVAPIVFAGVARDFRNFFMEHDDDRLGGRLWRVDPMDRRVAWRPAVVEVPLT